MLITLWNYIRGYVIIEVTGKGSMRFLNIAARSGTYIRDVSQTDRGLYMKVSIAAFWGLRQHARKAGCKIKIAGRTGAPFVAHRYRKRKVLALGVIFFIASLYAMSLFVWQVEVVGTERLNSTDVLQAAQAAGLSQSMFRPGVDRARVERHLLSEFDDIAWVNVTLRGTRATINLTETLPRQVIIDRYSPTDVVAAKDGLIVNIAVSAGSPLVRAYDVVRAGDILVSSEVVVREDEGVLRITDYVHANAQIFARIYYDFNFRIPYVYIIKNYTGNERASYDIILFGQSFALPFRNHGFRNYTRTFTTEHVSIGRYYPLPIAVDVRTYKEFTATRMQRSMEEAKALAEDMLAWRISVDIGETSQVIDKNIEFLETNYDALIVRATVAVIEDIAEQRMRFMVPN
ncbi:MAG: sporulation protein YqfD [Defluviitaleaceae bacterium]|nr:sporulation protein YqfD [Defluviitaleaceae bacterium]